MCCIPRQRTAVRCRCTLVPLSVIVAGEPVAVRFTFTVPIVLPLVVGLKIALNVKLCPGVSVTFKFPLFVTRNILLRL